MDPKKALKLIFACGLALWGWAILPLYGFSQTAPAFTLEILPQLPYSGERVSVNLSAQNFEATSTNFTWFRDNTMLVSKSGLGRSSVTIDTDPSKTEIIQIRVRVAPAGDFAPAEDATVIYTVPSPSQQEERLSQVRSDFTLEASDQNPDPGKEVTVSVKTFSFDKTLANYRWFVNGKLQTASSGVGQSTITIPGGNEGEVKNVSVEVTTPEGDSNVKQLAIQPAATALYWWADTTAPYWYGGKKLASLNSAVTVMAIAPAGKSPTNLSYQWRLDGQVVPASSGFGKNTFSFRFDFPVPEDVSVTMKNLDGTFEKTASIRIQPRPAEVLFYQVKPLRGPVYEQALSSFLASSGDSYDFAAEPFFFPQEKRPTLNYIWALNGNVIQGTFKRPWLFTIKSNSGESSQNQLSVEIADPSKTGEKALGSLEADFR